MEMNSKLTNKYIKSVKSARTPLGTSFVKNHQILPPISKSGLSCLSGTSGANSIYTAINNKPVSAEEHNKLLLKNQRLAKENAFWKSKANFYKQSSEKVTNELVDIKLQLSSAISEIKELRTRMKKSKGLDQIKNAVNLLMEDYTAIEGFKHQMIQFEQQIGSTKQLMSSLQALIETEDNDKTLFSDNGSNESHLSSNSSIRLSFSSQEIDIKRRLSTERIRRDFQILSELSTILEVSTEQRVSFGTTNRNDFEIKTANDIQRECIGFWNDEIDSVRPSTSKASESAVPSIKPNKTKAKKVKKPKTKAESKPEKKTKKQIEPNTQPKVNDPNASIYDFNDETDKENVIPIKTVIPGQRHSKRIRAKRFSLH